MIKFDDWTNSRI